jgi:predicted HicB family RNase H-like nuclease
MENTIQFNIRLPKRMVEDMEYIAQNLNINRNDWLKVRIAEAIANEIKKEKDDIMYTSEIRFIRGEIDEKEFIQRRGFKPTDEMKRWRKAREDKEKMLEEASKKATEEYYRNLAKKVSDGEKK